LIIKEENCSTFPVAGSWQAECLGEGCGAVFVGLMDGADADDICKVARQSNGGMRFLF